MNEEAPEKPSPSESPVQAPPPAATPTRGPSPAILIIGFIIIALLGIIATQILTNNAPAGTRASSPAVDSLKADIETRRAMLNRKRIAMGLEPLGGTLGGESAEDIATRLKSDAETLASLANSFQDLLASKEAQLDESRAETVTALKEQKRLRDLLEAANRDLREAMMDASKATTLASDLERARLTITTLQEELDRLRQEPTTLRAQLAECGDIRNALEARVAELEAQLAQSNLFAGSEGEILKGAIELFRALRNLEGKADSEIATAYSGFGARLGANVLKTCTFETGSAEVATELESGIRALTDEIPEGALIFVVGYASETGNVDNNRTLSSDRATKIARLLDEAKHPSQKVQAAYLGQTDRFSSRIPERNQIVEVWQIIPRNGGSPSLAAPVTASPAPASENPPNVPPLRPLPSPPEPGIDR